MEIVILVSLLSLYWDFTDAECLVVSPARLVVKYGDPASSNCSSGTSVQMGWEATNGGIGLTDKEVKFLRWRVDSVTDWANNPKCFTDGGLCQEQLNITVYKLPDRVSFSYRKYPDPMVEGDQYLLQCLVQNVAPIGRLRVTFYKVNTTGEQTELDTQQKHKNDTETPGNGTYTLDFTPSRDDDGAQLCCSAMLDLGPEGPQPPPVMVSDRLNINVHFAPEFSCSAKLQVRAGEGLTCNVRGNPLPSVTWLRDGQVLTPPTHLSREDAGNYTLMALNRIGKANHTVEVEVLHGPAARGASCQAAGSATVAVLLHQLIHWLY